VENKFIKILVVEDELTSRRILNSFLSPLVKLILPLMAIRYFMQ
jgi:CheY-like chemotaxis protein